MVIVKEHNNAIEYDLLQYLHVEITIGPLEEVGELTAAESLTKPLACSVIEEGFFPDGAPPVTLFSAERFTECFVKPSEKNQGRQRGKDRTDHHGSQKQAESSAGIRRGERVDAAVLLPD